MRKAEQAATMTILITGTVEYWEPHDLSFGADGHCRRTTSPMTLASSGAILAAARPTTTKT